MAPVPGWVKAMVSGVVVLVALMVGGLLRRDDAAGRVFGVTATAAVLVVAFELIVQRTRARR